MPDMGNENDNLDDLASSRVDSWYSDDSESELPCDFKSGNDHQHSEQAVPSTHRAYLVREKPKTLLRRASASASAFAAWVLD
ncbi:hypothetical protein ON010_g11881 [Phytophthora cinnamomi]|nr:hypothetical protein ON010_g11881 [Phytophthora cinnamomi]